MRNGQMLTHQRRAHTSYSVNKLAATWCDLDKPLHPVCAFPDPLNKRAKVGGPWPVLALKLLFWTKGRGQLGQMWKLHRFPPGWAPNPTIGDRGSFSLHKSTGETPASFYWRGGLRNPLMKQSRDCSDGDTGSGRGVIYRRSDSQRVVDEAGGCPACCPSVVSPAPTTRSRCISPFLGDSYTRFPLAFFRKSPPA